MSYPPESERTDAGVEPIDSHHHPHTIEEDFATQMAARRKIIVSQQEFALDLDGLLKELSQPFVVPRK